MCIGSADSSVSAGSVVWGLADGLAVGVAAGFRLGRARRVGRSWPRAAAKELIVASARRGIMTADKNTAFMWLSRCAFRLSKNLWSGL